MMVLLQVGLPIEGIALIIGIDRTLDMARTAVNITGDAMVACLVGAKQQQLDMDCIRIYQLGLKLLLIHTIFHRLRLLEFYK